MELKLIMGVIVTYLVTLAVASYRSNNNDELLKALRERPGSVLIINPQNRTHTTTNTTSGNSTSEHTGVRAIRFDGEWIHIYTEIGSNFIRDDNSPQHYTRTRESIPPNITAAITGPDGDIYFFSGGKFCKRRLNYRGTPKYCPSWESNAALFGCETNDTTIALCINTTICGISSNKKDKTNSIKYVYQGKTRWILTINPNNTRTGSVVQDVNYVPRADKISSNITAPLELITASNETKVSTPSHNDSAVNTTSVPAMTSVAHDVTNGTQPVIAEIADTSLKAHRNASNEVNATNLANITDIIPTNHTHSLIATTIIPIVTNNIPLLSNDSNILVNETLSHVATVTPLDIINQTVVSLNVTANLDLIG